MEQTVSDVDAIGETCLSDIVKNMWELGDKGYF